MGWSVCGIPPSLTTPCYLFETTSPLQPRRWLNPKSFIYKPSESRTPFIALSDGVVTGPFSEESGAGGCRSSGRWPVPRVWATHPNPAWRPKQPSFWPPFSSNSAPDPPVGLAGASP
jgi:hypothetical protein